MKIFLFCLIFALYIFNLKAQESDFRPSLIDGEKWPNVLSEEARPITTKAIEATSESLEGGFNELLPYVIASPYQGNAGSCLFMSHTGIVEWWLHRINTHVDPINEGPYDLSERYLMNLQSRGVGNPDIQNWRTDTIYRLNVAGINYQNYDYRFTKGWYVLRDGVRVAAEEGDENARYSTSYNWIDQLDSLNGKIPITLPKFKRTIIFADPKENQWNVNVAPKDIVKKIKNALKRRKAPILVIYNHVGYWHATVIVGFNDYASSEGCPFVSQFRSKMYKRAQEINEEAELEDDPVKKRKLLRKAKRFQRKGDEVHNAYLQNGSCRGKGVFYVRDSIYKNNQASLYDYDLSQTGEEEHYSHKIILREYEWIERLGNHIIQIFI